MGGRQGDGMGIWRAETARPPRIPEVDLARSCALLAMVIFHGMRDLEMFGLVPPGTSLTGGWALLARVTAASFLGLAGISLVLAHGHGLRYGAFAGQIAKVLAAALLITVASAVFAADRFIYFGILHAIAVSCILALPFVRLPAIYAFVAAFVVMAVSAGFGRALDGPLWLGWTGLTVSVRPSLDFVPLFPWSAACFLGVGLAKSLPLPRPRRVTGVVRALSWPGRHSLAIYLLHQPVLVAAIWLVQKLV